VLVVLAYVACALIWGTTYFAIRVCIGVEGYPTYLAAALRFVLAAAILGGIIAVGRARPLPSRNVARFLLLAGLLNAVSYSLVYTAEESLPGGLAAVIYGTMPLMIAVLGAVTRIERARTSAVAGALVSLAGIVVISWDRLGVSRAQATGVIMMLGSVLCSATYSLIFKRHAKGVHPMAQTGVFLAVTAAGIGLWALLVERRLPDPAPRASATLALLYLAIVGSVVAFASYFYLIQRVSLMTASTLVMVQPIVALIVDAIWEAEKLSSRTYAGVAVTLAGVSINLLGSRERRAS
jgi:drug/metabolite transporter (DMT)-like permease